MNHFQASLEDIFPPIDVHQGERTLLIKITETAQRFNSANKIEAIRPNFPNEAVRLA